jgi:hypothetical protein
MTATQPAGQAATGPLSARHPGGFAAVPLALLLNPDHRPLHVAVYAAVASVVDHQTGRTGEGPRAAHRARLLERAGLKDPHAIARALADLEGWGFLKVSRLRGAPAIYETIPTTADPVRSPRTRVVRSPRTRVVRSTCTVPQKGSEGSEVAGGTTQGAEPGTPQVVRPNDTTGGTPTPAFTERDTARLHRAVGTKAAADAIAEVHFRIAHPEVAGPVERPAGLAREIGECYRGRCRKKEHGNLHGDAARDYHRGRRADFELKNRAEGRRRRARTTDPDHDFEDERRRQLAALAAFEDAGALPEDEAVPGLILPATDPAKVTP